MQPQHHDDNGIAGASPGDNNGEDGNHYEEGGPDGSQNQYPPT